MDAITVFVAVGGFMEHVASAMSWRVLLRSIVKEVIPRYCSMGKSCYRQQAISVCE